MNASPRGFLSLTLDNLVSPTTEDNSFGTVSTSTVVCGNTDQARGNAASAFVEVSPLSYQSPCSPRTRVDFASISGDRVSRSQRANSCSDIDVPILATALCPASSSSPLTLAEMRQLTAAAVADSAAGPRPAFLQACQESFRDGTREETALHVEPTTSPSRASSLTLSGVMDQEEDQSYVPPRWYHVERLVYTGVFVGFLFRSYYVGLAFFNAHMPQLRRGVGEPNRLLAALLPTIGYDGGLDRQWISYLHSVPALFLLAAALGAATRLLQYAAQTNPMLGHPPTPPRSSSLPTRSRVLKLALRGRDVVRLQAQLHLTVGIVFIAIVHGPHFFMPLLLILTNYVVFTRVQRWCSYRVFMAIMWVTHVSLLYVIEWYTGFEDFYVLQYIAPTDEALATRVLGRAAKPWWSTKLRWYVAFRMTTLRLIAFNYDLWEATHGAARARERAAAKHDTTCIECAQLREHNNSSNNNNTPCLPAEASRCYKYRTEYVRDPSDYNFINYLAYILFPPLYIAGPMSSFNAFVSYMRVPSVSISWRGMAVYALRTGSLFLVAYLHLHFWFIIALSERVDLLLNASPEFQSYILYYYLAYLWLKFSFIWKTSRLFAMFSGIEVPEDMRKCFSNTTTVRNFWRDWHASFNLWIVRYMYIPMGGRSRVALSVLPIFLFIAIWHDPALQLIKWALCIAVMFVIELVVSACFGWVSGVFTREMAAVGTARTAHDEDVEEGEAQGDTHSSQRSSGGAVTALLRPPARFATRHLSPRVRAWCYRMLRVVAGMSTVFGLIVANLVGFSMQNSAATFGKSGPTSVETEADRVITRAFGRVTIGFSLCVALFMYSGSSLAVIDRDFVMHQTRWLKQKYGLQ